MSSAITRMKKPYSLRMLEAHLERENDDYMNKLIDKERSNLNYNIVEIGGTYNERIEQRIAEAIPVKQNRKRNYAREHFRLTEKINATTDEKKLEELNEKLKKLESEEFTGGSSKIPKNSVKAMEVIFTSDSDFFKNLSEEGQKDFFENCYEFAKSEFGEKNIITANVHRDETTPHLHLVFVPIKDSKLSFKSMYHGQVEFAEYQERFHRFITSKGFELDRGFSKFEFDENGKVRKEMVPKVNKKTKEIEIDNNGEIVMIERPVYAKMPLNHKRYHEHPEVYKNRKFAELSTIENEIEHGHLAYLDAELGNEEVQKELLANSEKLEGINSEYNIKLSELNKINDELKEKEGALTTAIHSLESVTQSLESKKGDLEKIENEIAIKNETVNNLSTNITLKEGMLKTTTRLYDEKIKAYTQITTNIETSTAEFNKIKEYIEENAPKLNKINDELKEREVKIKNLETHYHSMSTSMDEIQEYIKTRIPVKDQLEKDIKSLQNEKNTLKNLTNEIETHNLTLDGLKSEIKAKKREIEGIRDIIDVAISLEYPLTTLDNLKERKKTLIQEVREVKKEVESTIENTKKYYITGMKNGKEVFFDLTSGSFCNMNEINDSELFTKDRESAVSEFEYIRKTASKGNSYKAIDDIYLFEMNDKGESSKIGEYDLSRERSKSMTIGR